MPPGINYDSFSDPFSTDWSCAVVGQAVTCTYTGPDIAPGGFLPTLIINIGIDAISTFPGGSDSVENCATVRHPNDTNATNDDGCVTTVITPLALPDLTVTINTFTLGACGGSGCVVNVDFDVQNIGTANAGAFDILIEANDFTPLTVSVSAGIAAGSTASFVEALGPGGNAAVAPTVTVTADSANVIVESNEANNADSMTL